MAIQKSKRWTRASRRISGTFIIPITTASMIKAARTGLGRLENSGAMVGSVSGGCIEGAVVKEALASIADGKPRLLDFGVTDEQAWDVGLACGGKVQVFVEKVN